MPLRLPSDTLTLGADLRVLRKSRGYTLTQMADALSRSVGWLSQVERDLSAPSITDLRHMAQLLDVPVSSLFRSEAEPEEAGYIVRANKRRPIGNRKPGLIETLLSPDLTDMFEVVHSTLEPHAKLKEALSRPTQEVGYLIEGRLEISIGDKVFRLNAGDSFRIRGEPFQWNNPYDEKCTIIWVIAPPVY